MQISVRCTFNAMLIGCQTDERSSRSKVDSVYLNSNADKLDDDCNILHM